MSDRLPVRILQPYMVLENHSGELQGREKSLMIPKSVCIQYRLSFDSKDAVAAWRRTGNEAQLMLTNPRDALRG